MSLMLKIPKKYGLIFRYFHEMVIIDKRMKQYPINEFLKYNYYVEPQEKTYHELEL